MGFALDTNAMLSGAIGAAAVLLLGRLIGKAPAPATERLGTTDPRASAIVKHNGLVYISGQVAIIDKLGESDITAQTQQTLAKVDALLAQAGTDKSKLIEGRIWVLDVPQHFAKMNAVWNAWVDPNNKPVRYCVQSPMARPNILVEIQVVAAQ
eukprot:TRINITY_DN2179_c0_g1_i1.p1 TRINITY_DN2179_c0_g1~~TRINITY_DN2179_c0_g1_i1.p1  ORF type:complete len:153 (+),score=64.45 TRINITY_DN2179_c0_g1_i1:65-523(+)